MRRLLGTGSVRMGAVLLGLLVAAAGFPGGPVRADVAPSVMIVAGQSIGPVRLGMAAKDVNSVLGNAVPADGGQVRFPRVGVTVTLEEDAVVRVSTTNPQFRTARGAGVGTSLDDSVRLIGDSNQAVAVDGNDTTISYPFQGIGFVFRDGRAVEVFVVQAITRNPSLPSPLPEALPTLPPSDELAQPAPPSDTAPSAEPQAPQNTAPVAQIPPQAQAPPTLEGALAVQDLAETVDADRGILRITGKVAKTGPQAVGPVAVSARVFRAGGAAEGETGATAPQIDPAGEARFVLDVPVVRSVVVRYAVEVTALRGGNTSRLVLAERTVSRDAYLSLARARVRVSVELGAPSNIGPRVQVLLSIGGTDPIPSDWVREVQVTIPFTGGSSTVTLTPGQVQTIFIPSVAQVGDPQVREVVFNGS